MANDAAVLQGSFHDHVGIEVGLDLHFPRDAQRDEDTKQAVRK